jgi:hypothetical protein
MNKNLPLIEKDTAQLTEDVWNLIADEIGDILPSLVDKAIEARYPDALQSESADELRHQVAASLGHLSYE